MSGTVHIPLEQAGGSAGRDGRMLEPRSVGPDTPMSEVRETFASPSVKLMLVTDGERFVGTLGRDDLPAAGGGPIEPPLGAARPAEGDGPIEPHVRADRPSLRPDDPVEDALTLMREQDMTRIPVVDDS